MTGNEEFSGNDPGTVHQHYWIMEVTSLMTIRKMTTIVLVVVLLVAMVVIVLVHDPFALSQEVPAIPSRAYPA